LKTALFAIGLLALATHDYSSLAGTYVGTKDDYYTQIKLYDDSVFSYKAMREFPFEVSDGNWLISGDTVILNSVECADPELLQHPPIRTYIKFRNTKYFIKGNSLIPVSVSGKLTRSEALQKQD
jgi:hypothetical protein